MLPPEITRSPYHFPIRRPVTVTMIVLTAVVFGLLSYRLLPINLMPEITYPSLTVRTEFPGAAPEEVENGVTRPIEQSLGIVRNLVEMSSSSRAEVSDVLLEFEWGTDMNRATQDVREKLDVVFLAEDVKPPLILRYDPSLDPMIRIGLISDSLDLMQLRTLTEDVIKRELEKISGVAAVKVKGGEEAEIRVELDAAKLDMLNLSIDKVLLRLASENINLAGGKLQEGEAEYIVRTLNEFQEIDDIANTVIDVRNSEPIRLKDIARVSRKAIEKKTITRVRGRESVEIEIYKESDANPINVSDLIKFRLFGKEPEKKIQKKKQAKKDKEDKGEHKKRRGLIPLKEVLTERIELHILANQAEFIKQSIINVRSAAILGGLLAVVVLLFFLGQLLDTLVVAIVIPVSLVCAFAAMHIFGVSINIMSLGGLALGVGMMVDNAIVVIESIHRRREKGDPPVQAAVTGARIVGGAVTASTLTTIVVFFPIVFVKGIAGQIFGDMALTVIIALTVSLIVALFFIPMLLTRKKGLVGQTLLSDSPERVGHPDTSGLSDSTEPDHRGQSITKPLLTWTEFKSDLGHWKRFSRWEKLFLSLFFIPYIVIRLIIIFIIRLTFLLIYLLLIGSKWLFIHFSSPMFKRISVPAKSTGSAFRRFIDIITDVYIHLLAKLLRIPGLILSATFILFILSILFLLPKLGGELVPNFSQGTFNLELTLPVGTTLEQTAEIVFPIEEKLSEISGIKKVSSRIGGEIMTAEQSARGSNNAVITIMLGPSTTPVGQTLLSDKKQVGQTLLSDATGLESKELLIVEEARLLTSNIPSLEMLVTHPTIFTFKKPIEVILKGNDLSEIRRQGLEIESRFSGLPMLADVESTVRPGHPEVVIRFDRDRLSRLGLSARNAADLVRSSVLGKVPTRFREEEHRIDIRVQVTEADRESIAELNRLVINPGQPIPVTLAEVATLELREGPAEIRRVGGVRAAVISADVRGSDLKEADAAVKSILHSMNLVEGYDFIISGQHREMEDSLASLKFALLLAVFLVYVVMASQFESLRHPFLILLTIPLAVACVIPVLWIMNISLSVMVFLGLIVLAGIVVNNSIVLVDYTNRIVRSGKQINEAVLEAARSRMRPILMTSLTTILALLPMALGVGEGVEIRRPMAITVIFGLSFATLITLVVIPLLYGVMARNFTEKKTE
ncbi:MAG: efflux RND transporter permease subunit [Candidatus Hatepunaea meridiana]|nr:efflux RND transporter permease subunit [Candidatus Hatepunaea meridiana]